MKTKPTQHSVQELRRIGIQPDLIIVRGTKPLPKEAREKIALFTSVPIESVISNPDVDSHLPGPAGALQRGDPQARHGPPRIEAEEDRPRRWKRVASRFVELRGHRHRGDGREVRDPDGQLREREPGPAPRGRRERRRRGHTVDRVGGLRGGRRKAQASSTRSTG